MNLLNNHKDLRAKTQYKYDFEKFTHLFLVQELG